MAITEAQEKLAGAVLLSLSNMMDEPEYGGTDEPYMHYMQDGYLEKVKTLARELGADDELAGQLYDVLAEGLTSNLGEDEMLETFDEGGDPALSLMWSVMDDVERIYGSGFPETRGEMHEKYGDSADKLKVW